MHALQSSYILGVVQTFKRVIVTQTPLQACCNFTLLENQIGLDRHCCSRLTNKTTKAMLFISLRTAVLIHILGQLRFFDGLSISMADFCTSVYELTKDCAM